MLNPPIEPASGNGLAPENQHDEKTKRKIEFLDAFCDNIIELELERYFKELNKND